MTTYIYNVQYELPELSSRLERTINQMSAEGWELYKTISPNAGCGYLILIFRKEDPEAKMLKRQSEGWV